MKLTYINLNKKVLYDGDDFDEKYEEFKIYIKELKNEPKFIIK